MSRFLFLQIFQQYPQRARRKKNLHQADNQGGHHHEEAERKEDFGPYLPPLVHKKHGDDTQQDATHTEHLHPTNEPQPPPQTVNLAEQRDVLFFLVVGVEFANQVGYRQKLVRVRDEQQRHSGKKQGGSLDGKFHVRGVSGEARGFFLCKNLFFKTKNLTAYRGEGTVPARVMPKQLHLQLESLPYVRPHKP